MKSCEAYEALLDAFAEGDLFTEDMLRVQQHLNSCPACQSYLEDLLAMQAAFPSVEDTVVPEGFSSRVMSAVADQPQSTPHSISTEKKKTPWAKILVSLAACCAIVLLQKHAIYGGSKQENAAFNTADTAAEESAPELESTVSEGAGDPIDFTEDVSTDSAPSEWKGEPESPAESSKSESQRVYRLCITVEATYIGSLLDAYTPVESSHIRTEEDTATDTHYELTLEEYKTLLSDLADRAELPAEELLNEEGDTVLVIVRQS